MLSLLSAYEQHGGHAILNQNSWAGLVENVRPCVLQMCIAEVTAAHQYAHNKENAVCHGVDCIPTGALCLHILGSDMSRYVLAYVGWAAPACKSVSAG